MQQELDNFVAVAKRFCEWAEAEPINPEDDLRIAERLLTELHLAALPLPLDCPGDDIECPLLPGEMFHRVRARFSALPVQGYWDLYNPLIQEEEIVFNVLSDDLADIYTDIKQHFFLYEQGHYDTACWDWRFNFQIHWGGHLLSAQRAIYHYLYRSREVIT